MTMTMPNAFWFIGWILLFTSAASGGLWRLKRSRNK
jgi:hypothetical protein